VQYPPCAQCLQAEQPSPAWQLESATVRELQGLFALQHRYGRTFASMVPDSMLNKQALNLLARRVQL
jgi:hypothetical protein